MRNTVIGKDEVFDVYVVARLSDDVKQIVELQIATGKDRYIAIVPTGDTFVQQGTMQQTIRYNAPVLPPQWRQNGSYSEKRQTEI
jgi:hypothetical protein